MKKSEDKKAISSIGITAILVISVFVILAFAGTASAAEVINVNTTGFTNSTGFHPCSPPIQCAINSATAGDTINVAAGTYSPTSTIVINKNGLVLQGPQAGVDPRPSYGSTRTTGSASEAIIDGSAAGLGMIIKIDADNVVINGLEVKSGTKDMIKQENSHSGTTIKYCIIHDGRGDEGVQLKKCTNGVLEYNYVFEIADKGDGLNIADTSSNGVIRHNEVCGIHGENAAIYIYDATDMEISDNLVYGPGGNDGIKVGDKGGDDAAKTGVLVKDNVIHGMPQDGITVYMSGVTVEENEVYNCGSENGAIYVAWAVNDITITRNNVHDNTLDTVKWGNPGAIMIGTAVNVATIKVNYNNIYGNTPNGVTNKATGVLDATNNWWGNASGPYHETLNPSGTGDAASDNVDFEPWWLEKDGTNTEETESEKITDGGTMEDTPTGGDVTIDATGNHTITTAKYAENPGGEPTFQATGDYWDVHLDNASNVTNVTIEFCPADPGDTIYYWNATSNSWKPCSNQTYADECITVTITGDTEPSLDDLAGQEFARGRQGAPEQVPEYNIFGLAALIGILSVVLAVATLRKRG